jgi:hypothetical protein
MLCKNYRQISQLICRVRRSGNGTVFTVQEVPDDRAPSRCCGMRPYMLAAVWIACKVCWRRSGVRELVDILSFDRACRFV